MLRKDLFKSPLVVSSFMVLVCLIFLHAPTIHAQEYWAAVPPYNTLWPLWSPALSPVNPIIGVPVPVITSLVPSTVLPVAPGLTWDPSLAYPWLLYNTPIGLAYFDPLYGVNMWPPSSLVNTAGAPLPIALPDLYSSLAPTDSFWLQQNVLLANSYFLGIYPSLLAAADPSLLLAAATTPLPASVAGALTLGIPLPTATLTAVFPPPAITTYLTPAALLGL